MSLLSSRRVMCLLLYLIFHVAGVSGRGGKGGDGGGGGEGVSSGGGGGGGEEGEGGTISDGADHGSDIADGASSGLDLPPALNAVFALSIIIGVITALQFLRALTRFKHLPSRGGQFIMANDVGTPFCVFLASYTSIYTLNNALYAAYIASFGETFFLPSSFGIGMAFTGQFSTVLFYAIFLAVVAYRQRIQLNPQENLFNVKTFWDSLLLLAILVLGVAEDIIGGTSRSLDGEIAISNIIVAFQVFSFLASLDVAISSWRARARLSNAGKYDKIVNTCAYAIGPIVLIGGIYGIIDVAIERNATPITVNPEALLIATVVIQGIVSVAAVAYALHMMAPAKHPGVDHRDAVGKTT